MRILILTCCIFASVTMHAQWSTVSTTNIATATTHTGNVGIGTGATTPATAKLEIAASGDGVSILKLSTERAWSFMQEGTGSGTNLMLKDLTGGKIFKIKDYDNQTSFSVSPIGGYFRGTLGIGASPAAGVMFDVQGVKG